MCEEQKIEATRTSMRSTLASLAGSSMSGAAKAAPGAAVGAGAAELFSIPVQDLITWGTLLYIVAMLFYSAPKCVETVRYFIALWRSERTKQTGIVIANVKDHDLTEKILELEIQRLKAENERLKREAANGS